MNKTAVVTGASGGIGRACALKLAENGFNITVNYLKNKEKAEETALEIEKLGVKALIFKADTSDKKEVGAMFSETVKTFGSVDVLINNAGIVEDAYLLMVSEDSLTRSLEVNVKGYLLCAQAAALKMMKNGGKIINISSVSSVLALEGQSVYSATKGAVNSLTAVLAKELAPRGITVNAIAPGFIETDMLKSIPEDKKEQYLKSIPMRRFGAAEEIAEAAAALCTGTFSYMTGQVLILDGGLSL